MNVNFRAACFNKSSCWKSIAQFAFLYASTPYFSYPIRPKNWHLKKFKLKSHCMQHSDRLLSYIVDEHRRITGREARSQEIAEMLYTRLKRAFKQDLVMFLNEASDVNGLQGLRGTLFELGMKDMLQQEGSCRQRRWLIPVSSES